MASQALYMMNNEFIAQQAERWARRIVAELNDPAARIQRMYAEAFGRPPEAAEVAEALGLVSKLGEPSKAWANLAHMLMNTTEFVYIR